MGIFEENTTIYPSLLDVMPISLFFRLGEFQRLIFLFKSVWSVNKRLNNLDNKVEEKKTDQELVQEFIKSNKVVVIDNMFQTRGLSRYIYNSDINQLNKMAKSIFESNMHLSPIFADDAKEAYLEDYFIDGDLLLPNNVKKYFNLL